MNNETTNTTSQVKGLVQAALFAALIILMAMVPFLGYIPLGFTRATIDPARSGNSFGGID